jgi:hypothetical protein
MRLLPLFLLLLPLSGCAFIGELQVTQGSGKAQTESRPVGDFNDLEISGAVHVDLTIGSSPSLEITTDDNLLPQIKTELSDGKLKIYSEGGYSTKIGVKVKATTKSLAKLQGSGATHANISGIQGKEFDTHLSGASQATVSGKVDQLTLDASGASHLKADDLAAKTAHVDLSGASHAEVQATESIKVTASGASSLTYSGNPANIEKSTSGASHVNAKK